MKDDEILQSFHSLVECKNEEQPLFSEGWLYILLGNIQKASHRAGGESTSTERYIDATLQYLRYNYCFSNVTLASLAENLMINKNYLCKIFREKKGKSPIRYLIELRMKDAGKRLMESEFHFCAIAQTVGYKDALYFSKEFKKRFGVSPSKYREMNKK